MSENQKLGLGVNVDHFATIRQARLVTYPDPVNIANMIYDLKGVSCITAHLREDRRHIQDDDMIRLIKLSKEKNFRVNMEMAPVEEMVKFACKYKPAQVTMCPEKRQELSTESGLNVKEYFDKLTEYIKRLHKAGINVSLFVDTDKSQIDAASHVGADIIELHTGPYANAENEYTKSLKLTELIGAAMYAYGVHNLKVNAGHGLDYKNIYGMFMVPYLNELNIGHAIVAQSVYTGVFDAVTNMLAILENYSRKYCTEFSL